MSGFLWKFYLEDDVERFRQLLANASYVTGPQGQRGHHGQTANVGALGSSLGSSGGASWTTRHRKTPERNVTSGGRSGKWQDNWATLTLTRADINLKDRNGLTILHHAASSSTPNGIGFATALIEHPLIDLFIQDEENGWTALHRAFYFGNVTIARAILDRDMRDASGHDYTSVALHPGSIIRVKDKEGNSPFDVLNATITNRSWEHKIRPGHVLEANNDDDDNDEDEGSGNGEDDGGVMNTAHWALGENESGARSALVSPRVNVEGDEVFMFGSNKNFNLGFGDEDDRQYPERAILKRPGHLLHRFYYEQLERVRNDEDETAESPISLQSLPSLIQNRAIVIQDVLMSKLHTAVLTTDPEANLYVCGYGPGGRLGTGDEVTRFTFVCIQGGGLASKKIVNVGLGQNHTLAVTSEGDIFTWGTNTFGQLGYALPTSNAKDDEPVQTSPRQVFGPLKKEVVVAAAASRIHSVVHTRTALFTFGKNEGQLGLVDSDARSLDIQATPRRVGASLFSSPIDTISAIDRATICLLENNEVWVFANFGYAKVFFPLDGFTSSFLNFSKLATRYDKGSNRISKVAAGGDAICALTKWGDVFTVRVNQKLEPTEADASTTNPNKIRSALGRPQCIWASRKEDMAVRDLSVGQDGSVIICTESGSVWRRIKRMKIEGTKAARSQPKSKDYKFSRIPGLTRVTAVRSNIFGAYAAIRKDCEIMKKARIVGQSSFGKDIRFLFSLEGLPYLTNSDDLPTEIKSPDLNSTTGVYLASVQMLSEKLESTIRTSITRKTSSDVYQYDTDVCTTASDVRIPVHRFMLLARSPVLRRLLTKPHDPETSPVSDMISVTMNTNGKTEIRFHDYDSISLVIFIIYIYTDEFLPIRNHNYGKSEQAIRASKVRNELRELATRLELRELEQAVRENRLASMSSLSGDLRGAMSLPGFCDDADVTVMLAGAEVKVHSIIMCRRCPFFEGIFKGRAGGKWLSFRRLAEREEGTVKIDLSHMDPEAFQFVLRYIYCDGDEKFFDEVVTADLEELLDLVIEVMSIANELMIERLCQICQQVLARFVTARNACQLLNAVGPCSATNFKDACLEYLCMSLEEMLENHFLDDLDEDLVLELDEVVRENQRIRFPFTRSGRSETLLQEKFPQLAEARNRERQARIEFATRAMKRPDSEARTPGSAGSKPTPIDAPSPSPTQQRYQRKTSEEAGSVTESPKVRPKTSMAELIFRMDEDEETGGMDTNGSTPVGSDRTPKHSIGDYARSGERDEVVRHKINNGGLSTTADSVIASPSAGQGHIAGTSSIGLPSDRSPGESSPLVGSLSSANKAWGATVFTSQKLNMKEIMAQTPSKHTSSLSTGLSAQNKIQATPNSTFGGKLSQKERKKQQQQRVQSIAQQPTVTSELPPAKEKPISSPWQIPNPSQRVSLKDVFSSEESSQQAGPSHLTYIPGQGSTKPTNFNGRVTQEPLKKDTRQTQQRSVSSPIVCQPGRRIHSNDSSTHQGTTGSGRLSADKSNINLPTQQAQEKHSLPPPRRAITLAEPTLQLSMADIISQQQAEQDIVKQVVAKRPLHEIQQEQEFMEWWDAESKKVREGEEAEKEKKRREGMRKRAGGGGRRGGRGSGGRRRGSSGGTNHNDEIKATRGEKTNDERRKTTAEKGKQRDLID